jgi:4'-phosphopantetheinyl transferase
MGSEGKPKLGGSLATVLTFNLSHSGEWVLMGFAGGADVGVDLEVVNPFRDILEVAGRVLTVDEVETLRQLPPSEQGGAFFRGWTRKEALQKARGVGIWNSPTRVAAGLGSSSGDPSIMTIPDEECSCVWTVQGVPAPAGYSAAAAMKGESFRIEILRSPTDY